MALESTKGAVMRHRALYCVFKGTCLLASECKDDNLFAGKNGSNANGQSLAGNLVEVAVKETGVNLAGILGKGDYAGT